MVSNNYRHGRELLYKATQGLVISNSDIKIRLKHAFIELSSLKEDELPPDLWNRFSAIYQEVTSKPAVGDEGRIQATLKTIDDLRASEIADQIFDLFVGISRIVR